MKKGIHPEYFQTTVTCTGCATTFTTGSTIPELKITVCSNCHPFYSGKDKILDAEGRVDRFKNKYARFSTGGAAKPA